MTPKGGSRETTNHRLSSSFFYKICAESKVPQYQREMVSFMKMMMIMAFLVMSVNAKTTEECRQTTCKSYCKVESADCSDCILRCAFPGGNETPYTLSI